MLKSVFVLIILGTSSATGIDMSYTFNTKEACEYASTQIKEQLVSYRILAICTEDKIEVAK